MQYALALGVALNPSTTTSETPKTPAPGGEKPVPMLVKAGEGKEELKPLTKEDAERTVRDRIRLETYEKVMKTVGVQCGDGRNETGITVFGAELMGVGYPVLKEIEIEEGRELTDEEVNKFITDYPDILVLHTDAHGLAHVAEEIRHSPVLRPHFNEKEVAAIMEEGLRTAHVLRLLKGENGKEIEDALVAIAGHLNCQGCGHAKTVLSEEHKDPKDKKKHLGDRMLDAHMRQHLRGSERHRVVKYKGEHKERVVIAVETDEELDSPDDKVPALTPAGDREAFYIHPQVAKYRLGSVADYAEKHFKDQPMRFMKDKKGFVQRARDLQQSEAMVTAERLAPGYPIFKATVHTKDGSVDVKDGGRIPGVKPAPKQ
jgi:hypothetical protein